MLDPTIAEILLTSELRGLSARSYGSALSIAFEIVLRDGYLPKSEALLFLRLSEPSGKEELARLLDSGFLTEDGDGYRCSLADRIRNRANLASALLVAIGQASDTAPRPKRAERAKEPPKPVGYDESFETFWERYRAIGGTTTMNKAQSAKAFAAAIARGATVEDILSGLDRYAAHQNALIAAQPSKRAFVKMPTTWLNQSEWTAEYPSSVPVEKPKGASDPEGAPEPKEGVDVWQKTDRITLPDGGSALVLRRSIYPDAYVRFHLPGWLRSKGFPIAAAKAAEVEAAQAERAGRRYAEPDRSRAPIEGRDYYTSETDGLGYWAGTEKQFDPALWKAGHGEP